MVFKVYSIVSFQALYFSNDHHQMPEQSILSIPYTLENKHVAILWI